MKYQNRQRFTFLRLGLILGLILPAQLVAQTDKVEGEEDDKVEGEEELVVLTPFEVTEDKDRGYASLYTLGASRINTSLDKVPTSVQVLNQEFIQDVVPIDVSDATEWVSGAVKGSTPRNNQMIIRGTNIGVALEFRDGIRESNRVTGSRYVDPFMLQRIEVIKGPAGVLFGTHQIGGIVNMVSKQPLAENRTSIGFTASSYDSYGGNIDANRVFGADNEFRSRFLFSYKDGHTRHGGQDDVTMILPMFTYMINEKSNTSVTFRYEYLDYHIAEARGLWFIDADKQLPFGVIPVDVPVSNNADPEVGRTRVTHSFDGVFKHSFDMFGARWHGRVVGRFRTADHLFRIYLPIFHAIGDSQGNPLEDAEGNVLGFRDNATFEQFRQMKAAGDDVDIILYPSTIVRHRGDNFDETVVSADLNTEFDLGPTRHRVFTYFQWDSVQNLDSNFRFDWNSENQSVFNIRPRNPSEVLSNFRADNDTQPRMEDVENWNWAIQDAISLYEERVVLVAGVRFDKGKGSTIFANGLRPDPESNSAWTTKFGFVGRPGEGVSLFYNRSETFIPQTRRDEMGEPFKDQEGLQNEGGVKLNLLNSRVVVTASVFNIDFTNQFVTEEIPDPGGEGFIDRTTQAGIAVTEGWEADINLQPIDGLDLIIGLSDLTTGRVDEATGEIKSVRGVPTGALVYSILGKYTFQGGPLEGFYAGIGVKHVPDGRPGDFADSYRVPGYDTWKSIFGYRRGHWRINMMIDNLTDAEFVDTSVAFFLINPGERRKFGLSVDYTF